jgi:hypothetical protein
MADMMNPKQRTAATDYSNVNKADQFGGVAPAAAPMYQTRDGSGMTTKGPAQVIEGVYVQPEAGRAK